MKTKIILTTFVSTFILHTAAFAQGALTPSGAPAPTMKSLAQVEPRTPISAIPFTIASSGSYYLTTNVTGSAAFNGIIINASDVTLDLAGFTVGGASASLSGIVLGIVTNVTVHNGTVRGWGNIGISAGNSACKNLSFHHLTISANGGDGISCYGGFISDCVVVASGSVGIHPFNSVVRDCSVDNSGASGIYAYDAIVENCRVDHSGVYGIALQPGTATSCLVQHSVQSGIFVNLPGSQVIGNTLIANNTANSGISAGIQINDSNNRIENNHITASGSTGGGIAGGSSYTGNLIIKNYVSGNGVNNYNISGTQVVGPIIAATGTIVSTSPWANFSY